MSLEFIGESYQERQQNRLEESAIKSFLAVQAAVENVDERNDYGDKIINEIAGSIKEDFHSLLEAVRNYIHMADEHDYYATNESKDITPEKKDKLERLSADRVAEHNILISEINVLAFKLGKLKIDNNLIRAIIGEDRKLSSKVEADRRAVEKWARTVGKYLATVSETTL